MANISRLRKLAQIGDEQFIKRVNVRFPAGCRVALIFMDDRYAPPAGTEGTVKYVDDIGQVHVDWDNGSGLAVNFEAGDAIRRIS